MGLVSDMQGYIQEQNRYAASRGLEQDISIPGLPARCTDQLQPHLYQEKELLMMSHPGFHRLVSGYDWLTEHLLWEELGKGRKRTSRRMAELHKLQYARQGAGMALQGELALEELATQAARRQIPTVLTIPCMPASPVVDEVRMFPVIRDAIRSGDAAAYAGLLEMDMRLQDNEAGSYFRFIRRLLQRAPDAYLLPTECSDGNYTGAAVGDHWHHVSIHARAIEEVQRQVVPVVGEGRVQLRLSKGEARSPPFRVVAPLETLLTHPLEHPDNRDFTAAFGEGCAQNLIAAYRKEMASLHAARREHITQDVTATRLLYPLLAAGWEKIYVAGSHFHGCVQGTAEYFVEYFRDPQLIFLSSCLTPNGKSPELSPEQRNRIARQAPLLLDSASAPAARKAMLQVLSGLGTEEILREGEEVLRQLSALSAAVNPGSRLRVGVYKNHQDHSSLFG